MASRRQLLIATLVAVAGVTTAGCTLPFRTSTTESAPPPQLTMVDAKGLKLDPNDEHRFTVKVTFANENDQPFDLRQVNIQATVDGHPAHPVQDRLTGTMQSTSSMTVDRDFTTEQVVSNNSAIHIIIDTGSKPAHDVNVSGN